MAMDNKPEFIESEVKQILILTLPVASLGLFTPPGLNNGEFPHLGQPGCG